MSRASDRAEALKGVLIAAQEVKDVDGAAAALSEIKKEKLFKDQGYKSFSAWCEANSPFSVKYSYRLSSRKVDHPDLEPVGLVTATELDIMENELPKALEAAEVRDDLLGDVAKLMDEAEVRPEARHPVAEQAVVDLSEATQKAFDGSPETLINLVTTASEISSEIDGIARDATQAADADAGKILSHAGIDAAVRGELPTEEEQQAATPPPPPEPVMDGMGNTIPDHLAAGYATAHVLFEAAYDHIYNLRDTLNKMLLEGNAVQLVTSQRVDNILTSLAGVEKIIDKCRPFTVCLYCSGSPRQCRACGGSGFLTELQYLDSTRKERS